MMDNVIIIAAGAFLSACLAVARSSPSASYISIVQDAESSTEVRVHNTVGERSNVLFSQQPRHQFVNDPWKQMCIDRLAETLELSTEIQHTNLFISLDKFCSAIFHSTRVNDKFAVMEDRVRNILQMHNHPKWSFEQLLTSKQSRGSTVSIEETSILDILKDKGVSTKTSVKHKHLSNSENSTVHQESASTVSALSTTALNQTSQVLRSNDKDNNISFDKRSGQSPFRIDAQTPLLCKHRVETKLVILPGCVPKSILTTRCQGSCHSRSVPEWDEDTQQIRHIEHCTCCAPNSMRMLQVRFRCPGRTRGVLVKRVAFPFQCSCRPCAIVDGVDD